MPQAAPIIIPILKAVASAVIAAAVGYAIGEIFGPEPPKQQEGPGNHLQPQCTTEAPLKLIYGEARVGVNEVYRGVSGSDNRFLHIIAVLGEGPIQGVKSVAGDLQIFVDDKQYEEYTLEYWDFDLQSRTTGPLIYAEVFTGTDTQNVCSTLNTAISSFTDPMRHTAYLYVRMQYHPEGLIHKGNITAVVEGLKLFDPFAGGAAVYGNNPALVAYDMMTRPSERGGMGIDVWHGPVPGSPEIDTTQVDDAMDYCTTKGWTCNMPVFEEIPFVDNLARVLQCFRGAVIFSENQYKLLYRDTNYESVVMTFEDHQTLTEGGISSVVVTPGPVSDMPNAVRVKYYSDKQDSNGANKYQMADYVFEDAAAISADGDYREKEVTLYGLTSIEDVQKMAYYFLERWRQNFIVSFVAGDRAWSLEPMDLIQLSCKYLGWTNKLLRVTSNPIDMGNNKVALSCIFEDDSMYDDSYQGSTDTFYETSLPNPYTPPTSVTGITLTEQNYIVRNRTFTRLKVDFTAPDPEDDPFYSHVEVWVSIGGATDYRFKTIVEYDYFIDPVEEGEVYYIKLVSVSTLGLKESWDLAPTVNTTITGKTAAVSNLTSMTAAATGDTVTIWADPVSDADIEGYEVRWGLTWAEGIFVAFERYPSVRLLGVRPGTHKFWMSPKDTSGNYSSTPVSADVKVFIPPGYTVLATYGSWTWDYNGVGTHNNTEHTTRDFGDGDGTQDALKCSHTGGVLTGDYTTPKQDFTASEDVKIWGDFITDFSSSDTTWGGVIPSPNVWTSIDITTKTWGEIFAFSEAAQLEATLYYSTDDVAYDTIDRFELRAAEVTARYVYCKIYITDPAADSNLYLKELDMHAYEGPQ